MPRYPRNAQSSANSDDGYASYSDESNDARQEKLKQLISDLRGRWYWIALGLLIGVLGGLFYLAKAPKLYEAFSTVIVKQNSSALMPVISAEEMDLRTMEAVMTVTEGIKRPELLRRVAARKDIQELPDLIPPTVEWIPGWLTAIFTGKPDPVTPETDPKNPKNLALAIGGWTEVENRKLSRLVDILVTHPSAEVATKVANAIADEYGADLADDRNKRRAESVALLSKDADQAKLKLETAQNASSTYTRATETLQQLESREAEARALAVRYLPKHPRMIAAVSEVEALQKRFLAEFDVARSSASDGEYWNGTRAEWDIPQQAVSERINVARRLILARQGVLDQEIKSQGISYDNTLRRIREDSINLESTNSEVRTQSYALTPTIPSYPVTIQIAAAALLGGLAIGTLIAFGTIQLDHTLHTVAQAERETGLTAVGAISDIPTEALESIAKEQKVDIEKLPAAKRTWDPRLVFREGLTGTVFAEMFRVLRTSVTLLGDEKRRVVLFSSSLPGEGKTMVSTNFALATAQQGKKTLLIDLDLRKPAVHKALGIKRDAHGSGSGDVLAGRTPFASAIYKNSGEPNLDIILAGPKLPNPGEVFNSAGLKAFIEQASAAYDWVIIDSAPLLAVPDTRVIAPLVDNFCLVIRAEYTRRGAIERAIAILKNDRAPVSGIVFNGFKEKHRLMSQNYSYGNYANGKKGKAGKNSYGAYGAYGSDDDD